MSHAPRCSDRDLEPGGEIRATSEPGRGSTFTCCLPGRREAVGAGRSAGAGGEREAEFSLSRTNRNSASSRAASVVAGRAAGTTGPFDISGTDGAESGTGGIGEPLTAGGAADIEYLTGLMRGLLSGPAVLGGF